MKQPFWIKIPRPLLLVLFSPILVALALSERYGDTVEFWSSRVINTGFELGGSIRNAWRIFVGLVRIAGWITIVLLIATAVTALVYIVLHESSVNWPLLDPYYPVVSRIFTNKVAWAAISIVLGAMVAMSHLLNLEINMRKYTQELRTQWELEEKAKNAKERERRESFSLRSQLP